MSKDLIPRVTLAGIKADLPAQERRGTWGRASGRSRFCRQASLSAHRAEILGPFYRFGAPFRSQLAGPDEPGTRLILTGTVLSSDRRTPLPGTLIEVWQANHAGLYDTTSPATSPRPRPSTCAGCCIPIKGGNTRLRRLCRGDTRFRQISRGLRSTRG